MDAPAAGSQSRQSPHQEPDGDCVLILIGWGTRLEEAIDFLSEMKVKFCLAISPEVMIQNGAKCRQWQGLGLRWISSPFWSFDAGIQLWPSGAYLSEATDAAKLNETLGLEPPIGLLVSESAAENLGRKELQGQYRFRITPESGDQLVEWGAPIRMRVETTDSSEEPLIGLGFAASSDSFLDRLKLFVVRAQFHPTVKIVHPA